MCRVSHEPNDQELVIRLKTGDLTALAALDERYRVRIIRLIAQLAQSYEEAEDIYQEAIFKVASHIQSFDHRRSFHNWLHRIAKNQCIDEYRRDSRRTQVSEDDELLLKLAGDGRDALDGMTDRELGKKIQQAIDVLPKRQRIVAKLRLLEGLEYGEIAQRIGGSVHAAKSLFSVARKTLKARLQFYLSCFAPSWRILRRSEKGSGTVVSATTPVSGFFSFAVHLIATAVLCYFPMGRIDTNQSIESKGSVLIAHSADLRRPLRTVNPPTKFAIHPNVSSQKEGRDWKMSAFPPPEVPTFPNAPISFLPFDEPALNSPEPVVPTESLVSIESLPVSEPPYRYNHHRRFNEIGIKPTPPQPHLSHRGANSIFHAAQTGYDFRQFNAVRRKQVPLMQANLSAISDSFRRLRAFRRVQKLDAYSLAQLRRVARTQGEYPLLISRCRKGNLRTLLANGWTPVVLLRSPGSGKHLWVITGWDTNTDGITLTNPLERHEIQLSEAAFTEGWLTGNAPASCLLLSREPFSKSFRIDLFDSDESPLVAEKKPASGTKAEGKTGGYRERYHTLDPSQEGNPREEVPPLRLREKTSGLLPR